LTLDCALIVVFRKQHTFDIEAHRALGAHFGPLHKHATYAVPRRGDLDDVVGESSAIHVRGMLISSGLLGPICST
jgi:alpha-ketoglutarate-dependent taurine dioxygenase